MIARVRRRSQPHSVARFVPRRRDLRLGLGQRRAPTALRPGIDARQAESDGARQQRLAVLECRQDAPQLTIEVDRPRVQAPHRVPKVRLRPVGASPTFGGPAYRLSPDGVSAPHTQGANPGSSSFSRRCRLRRDGHRREFCCRAVLGHDPEVRSPRIQMAVYTRPPRKGSLAAGRGSRHHFGTVAPLRTSRTFRVREAGVSGF